MITIKHKGDFRRTTKFLHHVFRVDYASILNRYGKMGVEALSAATPVDSGVTAASWGFMIEKLAQGYSITWFNENVHDGVNVAILLQYGHGTRNGGYVVGIDYINPALKPVFDAMADSVWKELTTT